MSSPGGSVGTRALRIPWYGISAHGEGDERLCILPGRPWGIRSAIIYKDAEVIGLMDICPIRPGHAQITPREHFDHVSGGCVLPRRHCTDRARRHSVAAWTHPPIGPRARQVIHGVHCTAIGSIRLGSLFLTQLTRVPIGQHVISSDG